MTSSRLGRLAAVLAVAMAVAIVAYIVLIRGPGYTVTAQFDNANQLVSGNQVLVGGIAAGSVQKIELGPDSTAQVTLSIKDQFEPLREGTRAKIRDAALSGIADKYVEIELPPPGQEGAELKSGSTLPITATDSQVSIDQIFNMFDEETRSDFRRLTKGLGDLYDGRSREANEGLEFLNPALSTSRRLFEELNRDEKTLEEFIVDTAGVVGALEERDDDVASLVVNLSETFGALAAEKEDLQQTLVEFPPFMRRANTTFVNLRATLDDLDPLIDASGPAARRLRVLLPELRRFTERAEPVVEDLSRTIRRPGRDNDLVELTRLQPEVRRHAIGPIRANGRTREGAFPTITDSLRDSLPQLSFLRPYTPELVGWFNDFSQSGAADANGAFARIAPIFNAFTISPTALGPNSVSSLTPGGPLGDFIDPLTPTVQRDELFRGQTVTDYRSRCPGVNERDRDGSIPFTDGGKLDCDPEQRAGGVAETKPDGGD